jgi:hypothetical protein
VRAATFVPPKGSKGEVGSCKYADESSNQPPLPMATERHQLKESSLAGIRRGQGLAETMLRLQVIDVNLQIVRNRVARRKRLALEHNAAARTIILKNLAPIRVGCKGKVCSGNLRVNFPWVPRIDETPFLVVLTSRSQIPSAPIAHPRLVIEFNI